MEFLIGQSSVLVAFSMLLCTPLLKAQEPVSDQTTLLTAARSETYNLRSAGVKSFRCDIDVDWPDVFRSVGQEIPDDNPVMKAFKAARITVTDDLQTGPKVDWVDPVPLEGPAEKTVGSMRGGLKQMVEGMFQSWNPTWNGKLITMWPKAFTSTPEGYLLDDSPAGGKDLIRFDKDLKVTHLSSTSPAMSFEGDTVFEPTEHGLIMSSLKAEYRQPTTAPAVHLMMTAKFQAVGKYMLPASAEMGIANVLMMKMRFYDCTVTPNEPESTTDSPGDKNPQ